VNMESKDHNVNGASCQRWFLESKQRNFQLSIAFL